MSLFQSAHFRRIFLARHGESIANLNKQISGQLDISLSPKGKAQSLWLKEVLENEKLSAIYTSNLKRTIETAIPTADHHRLNIQIIDDLKERHFGVLQGRQFINKDLEGYDIEHDPTQYKPIPHIKGGENFEAFQRRVIDGLTHLITNSSGTILIIGHRNTNQVILSQLFSLEPASELNINIKNKYVYEIMLGAMPHVSTIRLGGENHGKKYAGLKDD